MNRTTPFTAGVVNSRGCTDMCCLLIFILFLAGFAFTTYYGYTQNKGNIFKVVAPYDSDKNFCGFDDRKNYEYLYITNIDIQSDSIF